MKLQFSGHDSFICKHFWLKKGYDHIKAQGSFSDESSVIGLGVGKNMVTSISYWLKAFGITENDGQITELGEYLFNERSGKDSYIENFGTIYLLHYSLIKTNKASIYNIFFNDFRKGKAEFTKEQFSSFVLRKLQNEQQSSINANTINSDINVFIRSYLKPDYKSVKADIEDDFSSLFLDLEFFKGYQSENAEGKNVDWYKTEASERVDLPYQLVLYIILDNDNFGKAISFRALLSAVNSPGSIFMMNEQGLYQKIEQITQRYRNISFTETAGISELQIKGEINKWKLLDEYYN